MSQMRDTSLLAYQEVLPTLGNKQAIVYDLLVDATRKGFDMTNTEIARIIGWPINTVTPRVYELREKQIVRLNQKRPCAITGRLAMAWKSRRIR